ncbi:YceI family protein [Euzebya tangerina]|uniref:YceI family protein n=1 Tax=Euzebya tangerina TaxID=591198 RepID=UPI000E30DD1E|nr:YceI family protein [Euzebya tangerina]
MSTSSNSRNIIIGIVVLVVLGAVGGFLYLNRPAAEEASLDNALTALDDEESTEDAASDDGAPQTESADAAGDGEATATAAEDDAGDALADASGTWQVDTTIGEFDFADATSTFAGFRVNEELSTVGQTEAVGRTPAVSGSLEINGTVLEAATIEADFAAIESDIPRRDNAMRNAMNVDENPIGTFELTSPVDFGEVPAEGTPIAFTASGDLTVNGMTNPVEVDMEAQVADGNIVVVGSTNVVFADYGIEAPQVGPVVSIEDNGTVEMQIWFTRA